MLPPLTTSRGPRSAGQTFPTLIPAPAPDPVSSAAQAGPQSNTRQPAQARARSLTQTLTLALALPLGLLLLLLLARPPAAGAAEPVWATGITEPFKDITMAFPVVGVVGARPLEEGAAVRRDQVVIELDKQLEELDVERKRLVRELAGRELERLRSLAERNAISVSKEEIERKQGEFDIARVDHDLAVAVVRRRQLVAPIDGHIARYFKDVGEKCEEQQPVLRIVDTRRCILLANVEPRLARDLRPAQEVDLEIDSPSGPLRLKGAINYISPVVDPASGLLRIKAVFDNPEGRIRPGVTGRIQLSH